MLKRLCFILFIGISTLQAQQLDSALKEKQKDERAKLESKTDTFKKQQQEKIKDSKAKTIAELKKDSLAVANKIQSGKASIKTKTDSTARISYKAKGKEALKKELQPLGAAKTKANNQWTIAKKALKNPFKLTGEIRSESFAATAQNPMLRNEPVYSRLYITPTISFLGLPFKANFFLTTENNNAYKSNFFSFKFDANAMRQQAAMQIQNEIDEAKKTDRLRQLDIQKNALETQRYEDELNGLKSKIPDADHFCTPAFRG